MNRTKKDKKRDEVRSLTIIEIIASSITAISILLIVWNSLLIFFLATIWWLIIPCFILTISSFLDTLFIRKQARKILLPIHLLIIFTILFEIKINRCDADRMASHYDKHETGFTELIDYTRAAVNDSCRIKVEFESAGLSMFHTYTPPDNTWDMNWNEEAKAAAPALMEKVGLEKEELNTIQRKLKKIGCIAIQIYPGYTEIGYKRVGMGLYYYKIYTHPLTEEQITKYDGYNTVYYRDNVMFAYGGGAIGSDVFIGKKEFLEKRRKKEATTPKR
ncbi:MAG: hypothetical protein LUH22_07030 [Bacteroides sp.]|nr:hypothetical protein [Bacteroides sp.]